MMKRTSKGSVDKNGDEAYFLEPVCCFDIEKDEHSKWADTRNFRMQKKQSPLSSQPYQILTIILVQER